MASGRRTIEEQHVSGRHNSPVTAWLPSNPHAVATFLQQTSWRPELLRNPRSDPLLRLEAAIRGSRETLVAVLEGVLEPSEANVRDLGAYLEATLGPEWATAFRVWLTERSDDP
jgi:hypothetical protein